jgi:hypothetical protein
MQNQAGCPVGWVAIRRIQHVVLLGFAPNARFFSVTIETIRKISTHSVNVVSKAMTCEVLRDERDDEEHTDHREGDFEPNGRLLVRQLRKLFTPPVGCQPPMVYRSRWS